jgi:hypothetical protein
MSIPTPVQQKRRYYLDTSNFWEILDNLRGMKGVLKIIVYWASSGLFKLLNEQGVWQKLIQNKYLHPKSFSQVDRGSFHVGNGVDTCFRKTYD